MKLTFKEIVEQRLPFDASGLDDPHLYLWEKKASVYYPTEFAFADMTQMIMVTFQIMTNQFESIPTTCTVPVLTTSYEDAELAITKQYSHINGFIIVGLRKLIERL